MESTMTVHITVNNRVPMLLSVTFDKIATLVWNVYWAHKFVASWIRYSCVYFYLWSFRFVAVSVCGRFGLWPFRFVAFPVCGRFGFWPFRFVAVPVSGRSEFRPFRFVAVYVLAFRFVAVMTRILNVEWTSCFYIACLCQSIEINSNKRVYRQSQVRMPNGCGVEWAECSLIIGTGCRVQVF